VSEKKIPDSLCRAIEEDLQPVRPIAGPWYRMLAVAVVATAVFTAVVVRAELVADRGPMPEWAFWASLCLQLLYGLFLVLLSLRESVPGLGAPVGLAVTAIGVAWTLQVLAALATYGDSTAMTASDCLRFGMDCMRNEGALALPALVLTLWLVFRALPVRPVMAGFLGGTGAALIADAANHLICPLSNLRHVLIWHLGAMLILSLVGAGAGCAWRLAKGRRRT
jgi:hypothetical protein